MSMSCRTDLGLLGVVEPAVAEGHVGLGGPPLEVVGGGQGGDQGVASAHLWRVIRQCEVHASVGLLLDGDDAPLVVAGESALVAAPAHIGPGHGDRGVRGEGPGQRVPAVPVVRLDLVRWDAPLGTVEPHLVVGPVLGEDLVELVEHMGPVVGGRERERGAVRAVVAGHRGGDGRAERALPLTYTPWRYWFSSAGER
jgi:hypothetical protein